MIPIVCGSVNLKVRYAVMADYKPNEKIPCVYMRGGTSKAVFFRDEDLPQDPGERDRVILSAFGSPDRRQIDGMGGANTSTSKCAVIKRSSRPESTSTTILDRWM